LVVLVNPLACVSPISPVFSYNVTHLVEVGLEEVHLLAVLEQARPVLFLELLLAQYQGNIATAVAYL
jgi:hypothetical protein